jgi:GMP synthase-like glutamine amidotransferase
MRVHYLQHVPFEGPGYISNWLSENKHTISCTRFFDTSYLLPKVNEIDALIILGGPMSVYDDHDYPWLNIEKAFIEDCIQENKKVLGICLGAQLVSVCLGATVHTANNKEIGWYKVYPTDDCKDIDWQYELFRSEPVVLHWHGEKFEIPYDGSFSFLSSQANSNQALYRNNNVIGLQFHLEVTETTLGDMIKNSGNELLDKMYIQTETELRSGLVHVENCNRIMATILNRWLSDKL